MTQDMAVNVKLQGENLEKIGDYIVQVNSNVKAGEREIDEADRETRRNTRRLFCLFMTICFVVVSIVVIMLLLFLPNDDSGKKLI